MDKAHVQADGIRLWAGREQHPGVGWRGNDRVKSWGSDEVGSQDSDSVWLGPRGEPQSAAHIPATGSSSTGRSVQGEDQSPVPGIRPALSMP